MINGHNAQDRHHTIASTNQRPRVCTTREVLHALFVEERERRVLPGAFGQESGAKVVTPLVLFASLIWPTACRRINGRDRALAGVARLVFRAAFSGW